MQENSTFNSNAWIQFALGQRAHQHILSQAIYPQLPTFFPLGKKDNLIALLEKSFDFSGNATPLFTDPTMTRGIKAENEDSKDVSQLIENNENSIELSGNHSKKRTMNPPPDHQDLTETSVTQKKIFIDPINVSTVKKFEKDSKKTRKVWSPDEDAKILELIKQHGTNWNKISIGMGGTRTGKQIRDRYLNKLDPSINASKWTLEEDEKLKELFMIEGKKWCLISKSLPGRTENSVKNRFYSRFKHLLQDDPAAADRKENSETKTLESAHSSEMLAIKTETTAMNIETDEHQQSAPVKSEEETQNTQNLEERSPVQNLTLIRRNEPSPAEEKVSEEDLLNIEGQIASLEESLGSCRRAISMTKSLKQNLRVRSEGNAGRLPSEELGKLRSVCSNLPTLSLHFKNTIDDLDRMLAHLLKTLKSE